MARPLKLSTKDFETIMKRRLEGVSALELADQFGVPVSYIYNRTKLRKKRARIV